MLYVVEYDENGVAWLIDIESKARLSLQHGMILDISTIKLPHVDGVVDGEVEV